MQSGSNIFLPLVLCIFLCGFYSPRSAKGQDHLEPRSGLGQEGFPTREGVVESYETTLANLFQKGYEDTTPLRRTKTSVEVLLRMTWLPSTQLVFTGDECFTCEEMSGVRMIGDSLRFESFSLTTDTSAWLSGWKDVSGGRKWSQEKAKRIVSVSESSSDLDSTLAVKLHRLWKDMLLCARYPESTELFTDTRAIFSTFIIGLGKIGGEVSDPEDETNTGILTQLGHLLERHSKASRRSERDSLSKEIWKKSNHLGQRLTSQGRCASARARR